MRALLPLCLSLSASASAVPPPPPQPEALTTAQAFVKALRTKDAAAYGALLADDFVGHELEKPGSQDRGTWLAAIRRAFAYEGFSPSILQVFYGGVTVDGALRQQVMLVERVGNYTLRDGIPGDCCTYYLTETVTFDRGKVVRIDRSALFETLLSQSGDRTDLH